MGSVSAYGYAGEMPKARRRPPTPPTGRQFSKKRRYSNRIAELTRHNDLTYAEVGDKVGAHEITIAKLATGGQKLTVEWIEKLAPVFHVPPSEVVWAPPAQGLRRVRVKGGLQADAWLKSHEWEEERQYDVMIPDDSKLRGVSLYGRELRENSMDLRYPAGTVLIFSGLADTREEPLEGRRYHVRQTRRDGFTEESVKTLTKGPEGRYWLKPESTSPDFQIWVALEGSAGLKVELLGRVRFIVQRED